MAAKSKKSCWMKPHQRAPVFVRAMVQLADETAPKERLVLAGWRCARCEEDTSEGVCFERVRPPPPKLALVPSEKPAELVVDVQDALATP